MPDPYIEQIMVADGDGDHPDVEEVKYETASQAAIDFENGANSLPDSTAAIENDDKLITRDGTNWVKKTFSKLWDYIKGKIEGTELTLTKSLILSKTTDASGTANNGPALIVGGTASQIHLELDSNEIMCKDNGTTPGQLYLNGDGGVVHLGKEVSYVIWAASSSAAQDKGEGVTNRYVPAKWIFDIPSGILASGSKICIVMPTAGHSYGVYLSIDNGTTFKPVAYKRPSRLTTQYVSYSVIELVYYVNGYVDSIFPVNGGDSRVTVDGGCWEVLNAYDSGNNAVTQTETTGNADYEVLFSETADNTTRTEGARKNSNLKFNPSTGNLTASSLILSKTTDASGTANNGPALIVGGDATAKHLELDSNEIMSKSNGTTPSALYLNNDGGVVFLGKEYYNTITGSGTAAQDKGEGVSPRYFPAKWTFNIPGGALTTGYRIQITIPVAGHSYGVYLSIDNGTTYKPIVYQGTTRLTTHFGNGIPLELVYHSSGSVADIYPLAGGDERTTVTGGVWRVLNAYDANTTYSGMTAAQVGAGTDTSWRVMRADYLKTGMKTLLLDICYPVGTIYTSTKNVSPATFLGGTWKSLSGFFLYSTTTASSVKFNNNAKDGGANTVTLTGAQSGLKAHGHGFTQPTVNGGATTTGGGGSHGHYLSNNDSTDTNYEVATDSIRRWSLQSDLTYSFRTTKNAATFGRSTTVDNHTHSQVAHTHSVSGGKVTDASAANAGSAHNTLPNYKYVFMWERTA